MIKIVAETGINGTEKDVKLLPLFDFIETLQTLKRKNNDK